MFLSSRLLLSCYISNWSFLVTIFLFLIGGWLRSRSWRMAATCASTLAWMFHWLVFFTFFLCVKSCLNLLVNEPHNKSKPHLWFTRNIKKFASIKAKLSTAVSDHRDCLLIITGVARAAARWTTDGITSWTLAIRIFIQMVLLRLGQWWHPHEPVVSEIKLHSFLVKYWVCFSEFVEPLIRKSLATFPGKHPNSLKVTFITYIFGDCNRRVKVDDCMPPSSWHEHRFAGVLNALDYFGQLA